MDLKEANSWAYANKNSFNIKCKKLTDKFAEKTDLQLRTAREKIKQFNDNKPNRCTSGGGVPRRKLIVGNSGKGVGGCRYCFKSLNKMIERRKEQKADIKHNINLTKFNVSD